MEIKDFNYNIPDKIIAQEPKEPRDSSKLLVVRKKTSDYEERKFSDIIDYIKPPDCLILNNTKVIPAKMVGVKKETGGKVEILLLKEITPNIWEVLVKPGRRVREGTPLSFNNGEIEALVKKRLKEGLREIEFKVENLMDYIEDFGQIPLPPYIKKKISDSEKYQTVYSKTKGSSAAPTAGLHFTKELIQKIKKKHIKIGWVTLHIGLDTFRPISENIVEEHTIHSEFYKIGEKTINLIKKTRESKGKVFAVGTSTVRVLETYFKEKKEKKTSGWTNLFIYPGFKFQIVDALITNFHFPKTTLILLVCAFGGRNNILNAYNYAIGNEYRFYSFGDSMLVI